LRDPTLNFVEQQAEVLTGLLPIDVLDSRSGLVAESPTMTQRAAVRLRNSLTPGIWQMMASAHQVPIFRKS
jgi:hypothetical protein